jgi:hypothetical protein
MGFCQAISHKENLVLKKLTERKRLRLRPVAYYKNKTPIIIIIKLTPWPESSNELYRPSESHLSAKLVSTYADRVCHVISVTIILYVHVYIYIYKTHTHTPSKIPSIRFFKLFSGL